MNIKKGIYLAVCLILMLSTAMLTQAVIDLKEKKQENQDTIARLTEKMDQLKEKVTDYEKEKQKIEFYKFKNNVFNLKYPNYSQIAKIVFEKSGHYGFSPYLVMALIQVESNFDQYAISAAGAYGLMQVNYSVWKDVLDIDFDKIFRKGYNIELGLKILKHYYEKASGNLFMALFRYNNGYKYNNKDYNGKIIATKFYAKGKETDAGEKVDPELSI